MKFVAWIVVDPSCISGGPIFRLCQSLLLLMLLVCLPVGILWAAEPSSASDRTTLSGTLYDGTGKVLGAVVVELRATGKQGSSAGVVITTQTDSQGRFDIGELAAGRYQITVGWAGRTVSAKFVDVRTGDGQIVLDLIGSNGRYRLKARTVLASGPAAQSPTAAVVKGQQQVSSLPLEQRNSSAVLLLAAGTTTTTGSGGNFTQQYSIHGQQGKRAVFALDGADTTDPELGGATISDFNVDAISSIDAVSGVLPASIGEGAAGYTNVVSQSGGNELHGVAFEFLRNSIFDSRNYFDVGPPQDPSKIPLFIRNEFGATLEGPLVLPHLYNGRNRTFFFAEYQGVRQIQGTTQVLSVPTPAERTGLDTTAFPDDTLYVPVNPQIQPLLNIYPMPNDPTGAYGSRTYATSSKVATTSDQFSIRIDQRLSKVAQFTARYSLENTVGPTTNSDQTAIDPSYAQLFTQGVQGAMLNYTRRPSPTFAMTTVLGFIRSVPVYSSINQTQPGIKFGNNLFEAINSQAGGHRGLSGNLLQLRQVFEKTRGEHATQFGGEIRVNRDTTQFGNSVNGSYGFGSGPAYSPVTIRSASGQHNISAGELLPDALTSFLTATPYSFTKTIGGRGFPQGKRIGEAAVHRETYSLYILDNWHAAPRLSVNYGLRYSIHLPFREPHDETAGPLYLDAAGNHVSYTTPGATEQWLVNPQPPYRVRWNELAPRLSVAWQVRKSTIVRAAGGITNLLDFSWPDTNLFNGFPYSVTVNATAQLGAPIPFSDSVAPFVAPAIYTPQGAPVYPKGTSIVVANTPVDILRFETDLAAQLPDDQIKPLQVFGQASDYRDGYLVTYTLGVEHEWGGFSASASYVGLDGIRLQGAQFPNNYQGASPGFAPFSEFNSAGQFTGGFGPENMAANTGHSTYNGGELVIRKAATRWDLGFNASYTYSRSIDNAPSGGGGVSPADPQNFKIEKGPSSFNIGQSLSFAVSLGLPFNHWVNHGALGMLASGWRMSAIGQVTSGLPFTVLSGVQQTGYGLGGGDRPDQIAAPVVSTSRFKRADYFGRGANNASFFYIPIRVPNGTGPFQGRLGTLGRNTFVGPPLHNLDLALWKDTQIAKRDNGTEYKIEFRVEFYNIFNIVNFGLPNNVITGSGFGFIHSTAANSRQLQLSLKLIY